MSTLKKPLPREESELGRNRQTYGDKSYYYAHTEGWEVPANAMVRSGPGLVTGGAPVKLDPDGQPVTDQVSPAQDEISQEIIQQLRGRIEALEQEVAQQRSSSTTLSQFSFSDEGVKCKIYVEVGSEFLEQRQVTDGSVSHTEAAVNVSFHSRRCTMQVVGVGADGNVFAKRAATFCCESDIVPEQCSYKVDRAKGRVTLTLKKVSELKKWSKITTAT
mmetsp:Transcript_112584/g.223812  ORF Transcript_112584/g.223812 Transcript_112584/m.223812 type:complete len:218 (-) Transcript_112584:126-779(-)|eukprot:CAMPEP_0172682128 /NCGR_PEP_ID=MMETSP1074-20121228/17945_1 /TAXON_ID=2916 /ORGANISM="Ceratium fusus, Strain PA161109" /LENGTH=217 /DNA_ID=CAMNT_0013500757 /DNA_START=42 /DNA_END=695 /DNA_ORIENTATION=-